MEETNRGKNEARTIILPASATVQEEDGPFTDDLIVEILSRLPARSVQRFKCVSPSWRDLIADPAHRRKLSQTLAGFLYDTYDSVNSCFREFHFATVSASTGAAPLVDPSLPFLPPDEYLYVSQIDTCNGLLLGLAHMAPPPSQEDDVMLESHYIVCNPATARWVDLPPHPNPVVSDHMMARLTFDPTISSHFHVLLFAKTDQEHYITGVSIYSSRTRAWNHKQTRSVRKFNLYFGTRSVFFHGMLHFLAWPFPMVVQADAVLVVTVDMEGQVWKTVRMPSGGISFGKIGLSQGCLHYATTPLVVDVNKNKIKRRKDGDEEEESTSSATTMATVWYMKDYDSKEWVLKHTVSNDEMWSITPVDYKVTAIHPDCDTVFFDSLDTDTLASYDMQRREFHQIIHLEKNKSSCQFLPYVPLFSDSFAGADGQ